MLFPLVRGVQLEADNIAQHQRDQQNYLAVRAPDSGFTFVYPGD
jgi:hypothetical protein